MTINKYNSVQILSDGKSYYKEQLKVSGPKHCLKKKKKIKYMKVLLLENMHIDPGYPC